MSRERSVASSTLETFLANVLGAALSLANVLVVARVLGPVGRGEVVFLMTVGMLAARLSQLGVQEANVNLASAEPDRRPRLATNSVALAVLLGWASAAAVFLLVELFPAVGGDADQTLLASVLAALPILVAQPSLLRLVHADYRFRAANVATLAPPVLSLVLNAALAAAGALTVGTALAAWLAGWAASVLLLVVYVERDLAGFGRPDPELARRTIGFGAKTHLGRVMAVGNYRLDQWFVGSIAGSRELGLYSIAVAWFEALTFLPTALAVVLRPDLVRSDERGASQKTAAAFRAAAIVTAVFVGATVALAPLLCVTVFGEDFRGSVDDLRVLAFGAFGLMAKRIVGNALTAQRRPMLETYAIGVGLLFTIALDLLLIPDHGGLGAAIASVIAYSAAGVAMIVLFARALGASWSDLRPRADDFRVLAARMRSLLSASAR